MESRSEEVRFITQAPPGTRVYLDGSSLELTLQANLLDRGINNERLCLCTYVDAADVLRNVTVCEVLLSLKA